MHLFLKLWLVLFMITSAFAENRSPKVVVIGAGLGGLTAAYRLHQKGFNVHIYEARSRVGGRVLSVRIGDHIVELGGRNITDGAAAENMHRLIQEFDLELEETTASLSHYSYFTGDEFLPFEYLLHNRYFQPEPLKAQLDALAKTSKNMREVYDGILDKNDPLYKCLEVRIAGYEGGSIDQLSPVYTETLYHMLLGGVSAAYQNNDSIHLASIKGGNSLLSEKMAQSLGKKIHLNKPLTHVAQNADHTFLLTFQDGQIENADILILACPCSVYNDIAFEDNILPSERLEAIRNVHYGTNAKILVPLSRLPSKQMGFMNDRIFCSMDLDHGILNLYCTGETSQFSAETILPIYEQERAMLERGLGTICPPFSIPVCAKDEPFATYEGPVGYSWPSDIYAKGSYAYIAAGQETVMTALENQQGELVKTLFAPIDQRLYFVGEHASILMDVPGTMEAACESGERTARMILHCYFSFSR